MQSKQAQRSNYSKWRWLILSSQRRCLVTKALLEAAPEMEPSLVCRKAAAKGERPIPIHTPQGSACNTCCPHAFDFCFSQRPVLSDRMPTDQAACHQAGFGLKEP
jgi:hypothetical protein